MQISRSIGAVLAFASFALVAGAAQADKAVTQRIPYNNTVFDQCTGENVVLTGEEHLVTKTSTNKDGSVTTRVSAHLSDVKGVGVTTGNKYVAAANSHEFEFTSTDSTSFSTTEYDRIISQGSDDNEFLRTTLVTENGVTTVSDVTIECRG